ncbi:MAG: YqgE/AlgH family protein [Nakamurella sp.]
MSTDAGLKPGSLLVATPQLGDPNFRRTVVYLIAHNERGSIGILINRPSDTAVHTVLPAWGEHASRPPVVYMGGPVQTEAAMALGVLRDTADAAALSFTEHVAGPVVLVNLDTEPEVALLHLRGLRVFAGHAGWSDGQLEAEIAEGAWTVLPGLPDDLLAGPMVDVWFRVLRRQGWPQALEAYHPGELARN